MIELLIKLTWDPEASVWTAVSDDVPGLALESGSEDSDRGGGPLRRQLP